MKKFLKTFSLKLSKKDTEMALSLYKVYVSCFPVSEYGDNFVVIAKDDEQAVRAVAEKYKEMDADKYNYDVNRGDFDTLYGWWKNPYQSRSGSTTSVSVECIGSLDSMVSDRVIDFVLT